MSRPVRDEDILAFIEGDATPEQSLRVEAALAEDADLRTWCAGARADRELLRAWGEPGASMAPPDLVEQAMAMAERSALLDEPVAGLYELKTQRGPHRLLTPARLSIAAGLLVAVSAGILALPALNSTSPQPVGPAAPATSEPFGPMAQEAMERQLADSRDLAPTERREQESQSDQTVASAPAALSDGLRSDVDQDSALAKSGRAASRAREEAAGGGDALHEAFRHGASALEAPGALAVTTPDDEVNAPTLGGAALEEAPEPARANERILALADEAAGWEALPRAQSQSNQGRLVLIGGEEPLDGVDTNGVEGMSLKDAQALASQRLLMVQVNVVDTVRYAEALRQRAAAGGIEVLDSPNGAVSHDAERLLAVLDRGATVQDLLNAVTSGGVSSMSLLRAREQAPSLLDADAIAWWPLPISQWNAPAPLGVVIEVVDAADGGPERR